jgi:uncharacterized protein
VKHFIYKTIFVAAVWVGCFWPQSTLAVASVWKISDSIGAGVLYLGGSVHALRSTDYPLPVEYARACDASARVTFEIDPKEIGGAGKSLLKAGEYPKGDSLKNHVDPRTYDYVRRFFGALNVSESKIAKFRPWFLAAMLQETLAVEIKSDLGIGNTERISRNTFWAE